MRRWALPAATLLVGILLGAGGGIFADQAYPDYVPAIGLSHGRGQLDQADLEQALRIIQAHYYDPKLDYHKLSNGTVQGLVQALGDPYTNYLSADQFKNQQDSYAGRHSGVIGIYVSFDGSYPTVSGLVPGSPAEKAGLRTGDVIQIIDGKDAKGLTADQTAVLIRGQVGTSVLLGLRRGDQQLSIAVQRGDFASPMVVSTLLDSSVLYVRVYQFGTDTQSEFDSQLKSELGGAKGVVLDLRDNPGGYIDAATAMISRFLPDGEAYELRDRSGSVDRRLVSGDHPATSVPLVVLVNAATASAAEIVSGSLQARHRAQLLGAKTFGKGSVQVDFQLGDGSDLHLTIEHWFLPDGRQVDKVGLQPDVPVALGSPADMFDVVQPALGHANDAQLNRALAILEGRS
ncbi:MAG TPA: S41 family peptidase [Candidatus Dormibacteraeota bacterium]